MEYTLITYGDQEVLAEIFNAIAALINSKTGSIYNALVSLGLSLGLLWAIAQMIYGDRAKFLTNWLVPFYLCLTLLFAPTCKLHIKDPTNGQPPITVAHVPWGLGALAGTVSNMAHTITQKVEATFSAPNDLAYNKTGTLFASNLLLNSTKFRVTDPDLQDTMREYVNQCIFYDALLGKKYTLKDLKYSGNIWKLASRDPSPARAFLFKEPGQGKRGEILTCKEGTAKLKPYLDQETETAFQYFGGKLFGVKGRGRSMIDASTELKKYLPIAYGYMTGMAEQASDIMRQQIMLNAVGDTADSQNMKFGNPVTFATQKAYLQQRMTQQTTFGIAVQKLLAMKNVMEALIYVSFIFIVPMALLPLGWKYISKWAGLVLWVNTWPPLYAILNFLVNAHMSNKGSGYLEATSPEGVSLASSIGFANLHADMAAQAGFLTLSVAALSYALVKGGAASFIHLAGHLGGASSAAASQSASEVLSGNYSWGNVNEGSVQLHNHSFAQQMWSPSLSTGHSAINTGMSSRITTADGDHVLNIANSNLRSAINMSEGFSTSLAEQGSKTESLAHSQLVEAAQNQMEAYRTTMDLASHQAHAESSGTSSVHSESAADRQSLSQVEQMTDKFAQDHSISKDKAWQMLGRASVEVGGGFGPVSGKLSAEGSRTVSSQDRDLYSKAKDFVEQTGLSKNLDKAVQAVKDGRFSATDDAGSRYTQGINQASDKSDSLRTSASHNLHQAESYAKQASWVKQNGSSINTSLNQDFVGWLKDQSAPYSQGPMGIQAAETMLAQNDHVTRGYQQRYLEDKVQNAADFFAGQGYTTSFSDDFNAQRAGYQGPSVQGDVLASAQEKGFGDSFSLEQSPLQKTNSLMSDVDNKISDLHDQLEDMGDAHKKPISNRLDAEERFQKEGQMSDLQLQLARRGKL